MAVKVTVGRIVHFVDEEFEHLAALVTGVEGPGLDLSVPITLTVFGRRYTLEGVSAAFHLPDPDGDRAGTWHWTERE